MTRRRAVVVWMGIGIGSWLLLAGPTGAGGADCGGDGEVQLLVTPRAPRPGDRVRVLAASDVGSIGDLAVTDGDGRVVSGPIARLGGPPWSAVVTVDALPDGTSRVEAVRNGETVACATVGAEGVRGARAPAAWDRASEALYAAWIEHLFDAPPAVSLSFDSLQEVLLNPERNLLYDYFGTDEEDAPGALGAPPDCADMPYLLRGYFAWKRGLPFGYRKCSRGSPATPPSCGPLTVAPEPAERRGAFGPIAQRAMDSVHSGSARTALADDATDFYPVALTREALRPGTVYADPYGHTLMIVQWVPQTATRGGMLLAVDAQPDNSVSRKRFWEGTFLFADDVPGAGPGFKAFRPLVADGRSGLVQLSNAALTDDARFAPYSVEQMLLDPEAFYARVGRLINPDGLRPEEAYRATLDALTEQLETRVDSVQRGEDWVRSHPAETVPMPDGAGIFETIGPWEDYATPSRDLRLQIAMKVLLELPERIIRHPELFVLDGLPPLAAATTVERAHADAVEGRAIEYVRSDGTRQRLTVGEILARRTALEMAYNPNDCVEVRWGAPPGSPEHASCLRDAPAEQRTRMREYRSWFHEGRRPSR